MFALCMRDRAEGVFGLGVGDCGKCRKAAVITINKII